jgi:hypothetical protein
MANQLSAKELQELKKLYQDIDGLTQSQAEAMAKSVQQIGNAQTELSRLRDEYQDLTGDISYAAAGFKKIVQEITKQNIGIKEASKAYKGLSSIAEKIQYHQKEISNLSSKEIAKLKEKVGQEKTRLENASDVLKAKRNELATEAIKLSNAVRLGLASEEEKKRLKAINAEHKQTIQTQNELNGLLQGQDELYKGLLLTLGEEEKKQKEIEKRLGVSGNLIKGISKIPVLGNLINAEEALIDAQKKAKEEGSNRFKVMGNVFKSLGSSLKTNLTDPLVVGGLLLKGFKMFLELGFAVDKQITELGKSMAVTKDEAALTRDRFVEIQNSSNNILDITKNLVEAQGQLANAFGATKGFTDAQLQDQIMLTKQVGLEEEAAAGLQQLALANGKSANDILKSTIKQTAALARQTGVQLDNKKVLNEVAKVSGQLRLQYQNNPDLIAKAVVQTQKLGVSLEQAKNIAGKLLDFESSITSELEAELLTGKNLNLENARLLALQGDSAGAVAEIAKQTGSAAEFSKMNVIAQQSFAEAVGMSADELANSLVYQENLTKLGSKTRKQIEEQIELAKQQGDMDKVRMLERSVGDEKNALAALQEISAQEKFNATVEKLKSMLSDIVSGPAAKFVDMLGKLASNATLVKTIFYAISGVLAAIAASMIITAFVTNPIGAGIGLAAGLGAVALLSSATSSPSSGLSSSDLKMKTADDGIIGPDGGLVVSGKKGSIKLNEKDSVIAGTNLGGGNNRAIEEQNNLLKELANRPVKVDVGNFYNESKYSSVRIQ